MKNWKTEKSLYTITEMSKNSYTEYPMRGTGLEVMEWCKAKREANGYVPGVGGDKSYTCIAVLRY